MVNVLFKTYKNTNSQEDPNYYTSSILSEFISKQNKVNKVL